MRLMIETRLDYVLAPNTSTVLLQIEAANLPEQQVVRARTNVVQPYHFNRISAEESIGDRIWVNASDRLLATYWADVEIDRPDSDIAALRPVPLHEVPGDVVKYLLPSRYCQPARFGRILETEFPGLTGGALIARLRDWIEDHLDYVPGVSNETTDAVDTFLARQGICRDYVHVLVSLARAADIPARFVSVYAPGVQPPDFHAVAEVFLGGRWHLVDPTGMARPSEIACIGVGRDAGDVAFMTVHGMCELLEQSVSVKIL